MLIIHGNDFEILANSASKRSRQIKAAWGSRKTYSGRNEGMYYHQTIPLYNASSYSIEFIEATEILNFLENNLDVYERCVGSIELFGVEMKRLRDLNILDIAPLEEECSFVLDDKKTLRDAAYLNYIKHLLKPLEGI